jgi:hypothetical protein
LTWFFGSNARGASQSSELLVVEEAVGDVAGIAEIDHCAR